MQVNPATTSTAPPAQTTPTRRRPAAPRPDIVRMFIPIDSKRRSETAAYSKRHYGRATSTLRNPHVVVEHMSETSSARAVYDTFAPDVPDSELHELPGICSHFVVDRDGTIYQLAPLDFICRHTVGLNYTAIGIEHVGSEGTEVLGNRAQLRASLRLTHWLQCRFGISRSNVIGHNESLSSPYHRELVPSLRSQTHADWPHASMEDYRRALAGTGGC